MDDLSQDLKRGGSTSRSTSRGEMSLKANLNRQVSLMNQSGAQTNRGLRDMALDTEEKYRDFIMSTKG